MSSEQALDLTQQALVLALVLVSPILIAAVMASLVTAILQTATHVQEPTLSFVPRLLVVVLVVLVSLPWGAHRLVEYSVELIRSIVQGHP